MLKHLLLTCLLLGLLLAVPLALAQEEAAAEAPTAAPGISTLIFLLGAGAVIIVGGARMARDSYRSDDKDGS
jgi:hypothetical protein